MKNTFEIIHTLNEIKSHLSRPQDTLIVFDVDYVLTHPNEPAYQFPNFSKNLEFVKKTFSNLTHFQKDLFSNLMVFHQSGSSLVEECAPKLINSLNNKGYKVVALTAALTSSLIGQNTIKSRVKHLKSLGIDFSKSFINAQDAVFKSFDSNMGSFPEYYKGILFSNGENLKIQKGEVLKEFLKHVNYMPSTIVVIDDRQKNLESIANTFKCSNIEIKGLLYKGSLEFDSDEISKEDFELKWTELSHRAKCISENNSLIE